MARSEDIKTPLARIAFAQSLFEARAGEEGGKPKYLVAYKDPGTGDQDERWFHDGEIELVERVKQEIKPD